MDACTPRMRRSSPSQRHRRRPAQASAFAEECEQLYAAEQHEKLLDKFISALDVVLSSSSSSDAGERRRPAAAAAPGAASLPA